MSEQQDRQIQQAAQQALHEIDRMHQHAVDAVRGQYPAPVRPSRHAAPDDISAWLPAAR